MPSIAEGGSPSVPPDQVFRRRRVESLFRISARHFLHNRVAVAAAIVLVIMVTLAIGAPWLAANVTHHDPNALDLLQKFHPPDSKYWLGADEVGRDVATRLLYGARVSLGIGVLAALVMFILGSIAGALGGYFGGFLDDRINDVINTLQSVPTIFLLIILAAFNRPTPISIAVIIGTVSWMGVARLVRGGFMAVKARDYVMAARMVGADDRRIIMRHIMPNVASTMIVIAYIDIAGAILSESGLSFLGLGVQPPDASWGNMLRSSMSYLFQNPFLIFPPGILIFITVLCLYVVGDGLRDALDPQLRLER